MRGKGIGSADRPVRPCGPSVALRPTAEAGTAHGALLAPNGFWRPHLPDEPRGERDRFLTPEAPKGRSALMHHGRRLCGHFPGTTVPLIFGGALFSPNLRSLRSLARRFTGSFESRDRCSSPKRSGRRRNHRVPARPREHCGRPMVCSGDGRLYC
jgi:hypothetical protein